MNVHRDVLASVLAQVYDNSGPFFVAHTALESEYGEIYQIEALHVLAIMRQWGYLSSFDNTRKGDWLVYRAEDLVNTFCAVRADF